MQKQIWGGSGRPIWGGRGRPRSEIYSYKVRRILVYLARIAVMYKVDSREFFNSIVEAWNHEESECKQLVIVCRERTKNSAIFLFTSGRKVVAQFPISSTILQGKNQLESYAKIISDKVSSVKEECANLKVEDLKVGMKKVSLKAKVLEIPKSKVVYTRFGTWTSVSNALIGDETGSIRMSLWNQQINTVSKGDVIDIKNSKVARFNGELQLKLGRSGNLCIIE